MPSSRSSRHGSASTTKGDAAAVAAAVAAGIDPVTLVTGGIATQTEVPQKEKKKGKKKKLTKAEKDLAKLQKSCDDFRKSGTSFQEFVCRLDNWIKDNHKKAMQIFTMVDIDGEGYVTFDEFKAVLNDMGVPCTAIELHTLCQLLDHDEAEEVNYQQLSDGLKCVREREFSYTEEDINPGLVETKKPQTHCPSCKLAIWDGEAYKPDVPRYIEVLFRLVTFEGFKAHPGHFQRVIPCHTTGYSLLQMIRDETGITSNQLALFTDKTRDPDALLSPELSLEEMGFEGGPTDEPPELLIYYDYRVEFTDCPILLCDHYFGQKDKI